MDSTIEANTQPEYIGKYFVMEPYIYLRWARLVFPLAMVLASLTHPTAIMRQSHRSNKHARKDDTLVLLLFSLTGKWPRGLEEV